MELNEISGLIVDTAYQIHTDLGPGLLESVYEVILASELRQRGLNVQRQVPVPIEYRGLEFTEAFRADLIVENQILIELKSVEQLQPVHAKQVHTYLKLSRYPLALLINFGGARLKGNIERILPGTTPSKTAPNFNSPLRFRRPADEFDV